MAKQIKTTFGAAFAKQFAVIGSKLDMSKGRQKMEDIARQLGADLTDPEQFRTVQELAHQR